MSEVTYKLIPNCSRYRVGDDGTVWKFYAGRKRKPEPRWKQLKTPFSVDGPKGIPVVNVFEDSGKHIHTSVGRLVLLAFVGPCPPKHECCHFPNRDRNNNRLDNLRWGTGKENQEDQRKHGTLVGGERHGMAKLTNEQINEIHSLKGHYKQCEIAEMYNVTDGHISSILSGKRRTESSHNGKGLK